MLYCDRIDKSEEIDLTESKNSKGYLICHFRLFNH